ncbi:glycosyltransferase family 2 protein [Phyllobacterium sp. SB3]|uniref:glycosyltransferase family 2 protein n=1 Tax=Phyllobacterium sp. SB3 TaxID=3156073 RepID=UPI0032AE9747
MDPKKYPVQDAAVWQELERVSLYRSLKTHFRHIQKTLKNLGKKPDSKLRQYTGSFTPLTQHDLPLICIVRNANNYIRAFLKHYRELGVTRFIFVDDRSDDGTLEVLSGADDVDLYVSDKTYQTTALGAHWRDALLAIYGRDHWYVSVDADEFLVFPGSETRNIKAFIGDLEAKGYSRCLAMMLDTYPPGALDAVEFHDDGRNSPFAVSSHFDGDSYTIKHERFGTAVRGGPRKRLFNRDMRQVKFPLFHADKATDYRRGSVHGLGPVIRNFVPVTSVLLHYRFSAHSVAEFKKIVKVGGHAGGSAHYSAILDSPEFSESFSLAYDGSAQYKDSQDLIDRGFMMDLRT